MVEVDGDECDDRFQSEIEIFASNHCLCVCVFMCFCCYSLPVPHSRTSKSSIMPQTTNLSFILSSVSWACAFALLFLSLFLSTFCHSDWFRLWLPMTRYICSTIARLSISITSSRTLIHFQCILMNLIHWQQHNRLLFFFSEKKKISLLTVQRTISLLWPHPVKLCASHRCNLQFLDDKMQKYIINEFQRFIYTSFLLSCIFRMLNSIRLIVVSHYFLMFENPLIVLHFIFCFVCGSRAMRLYHQVRFTISLHSNAMHLQVNRIWMFRHLTHLSLSLFQTQIHLFDLFIVTVYFLLQLAIIFFE